MEQTITQQGEPKSKGKKILLVTLSLAATGTLGYFGFDWWKKRQQKKDDANNTSEPDLTPPPSENFSHPHTASAPKRNDDFPLVKGSKGARVKQLQEGLIEKHGKQIFSKYGADGDFGSELVTALAKENYPASIDENTFNVIVQGAGLDSDETATALYKAAISKNFSAVISSLQKLKSKDDYTSVSDIFKSNYQINGVRQTLVNGLLNSFSDEKQKQAIRLQFTRMGLNYDGKKWSLSGIFSNTIITTQTTLVWVNPKAAIKVPANMVLGKEVIQKGNHTLFENNGQHFLVESQSISRI
jgi:hypothetical protein